MIELMAITQQLRLSGT